MTAQAVAERNEPTNVTTHPASDTAPLMAMIERVATDPSADVDKVQKLLDMYERVEERRAKAAYAAAFAAMQPELPEIPEHGKGHGSITYALWEDINELVKPVLAKHGFGISFLTGMEGDRPTVTAILEHSAGHSKQTTMVLPLDTSGSKNGIQALGSSTSYGKRYTASALLNLTSRGEDDDGKKTEIVKSKAQARGLYAEMQAEIDACGSLDDLSMLWGSKPFQTEFKLLPPDWRESLIARKEEQKRALSEQRPGYVAPTFPGDN